jgi:hypothetical protein
MPLVTARNCFYATTPLAARETQGVAGGALHAIARQGSIRVVAACSLQRTSRAWQSRARPRGSGPRQRLQRCSANCLAAGRGGAAAAARRPRITGARRRPPLMRTPLTTRPPRRRDEAAPQRTARSRARCGCAHGHQTRCRPHGPKAGARPSSRPFLIQNLLRAALLHLVALPPERAA